MSVLILGARGMLGMALGEIFKDNDPVLWDQEELDITDEQGVREKIAALRPRVIINAAAYTDVDGAETERETAFAVNDRGVRNVAYAARKVGAMLVHYSTDYVFPGDKRSGYAEEDAPGPAVNVYGESKLAGERALAEIAPRYYLLRTAWLYGPSSAEATAGKPHFVDSMLQLARHRKQISVVNDQYGSPTFTNDVAAATKVILDESYTPGVYHVVNDGTASWYDFACEIFRRAGLSVGVTPVSSQEFPRPARRPRYSVLRNTRGPALRPWQEALAEYIGP